MEWLRWPHVILAMESATLATSVAPLPAQALAPTWTQLDPRQLERSAAVDG